MTCNTISRIGAVFAATLINAACTSPVDEYTDLPAFSDLDTNNDGQLDMDEAQSVPDLAAIFKTADTDKDGYLSVEEFSHATLEGTAVSAEAAAGYKFEVLDADGNMAISAEESTRWPALAKHFMTFDADGNGVLDSMEYDRAIEEGLTP